MMNVPSDSSRTCYGVRSFNIPQTANIVIGLLSALVIIFNSLAMISVLKNYRRLRQRIYVFVISLAATDILAGIIFLSDAMNSLFIQKHQQTNDQNDDGTWYHQSIDNNQNYIRLRPTNDSILSQELLETFKAGVVILSVLNTALVTFALYKRTTSMGRHHEDFKHMSATFSPDGHSFLPAFDTMMRVLSIGSPAATNGFNKNMGRHPSQMRNGDSPLRRVSTASRFSNSSPQRSSFSKDPDAVFFEKIPDEPGSCTRKPQIVRGASDNAGKGKQRSVQSKKRSSSMGRLMNTGRRMSQVLRSRSTSGTQSYVGRHSYSVMSKCATGFSLFLVWTAFVLTCVLPLAFRRSENLVFTCPMTCLPVQITQMIPIVQNQLITESNIHATTVTPALTSSSKDLNDTSNITRVENIFKRLKKPKSLADQGLVNSSSNKSVVSGNDDMSIGDCSPPGFSKIPSSFEDQFESRGIASAGIVSKSKTNEEISNPTQPSTTYTFISRCSLCSTAFFPLSKSHMVYVASVTFITWCWLIVSASRLLHLRKHSSNVFVRCSALWRFMFMTALFFFVTMAPYVAWIILDYVTASSADMSPLWNSGQQSLQIKDSDYNDEDIRSNVIQKTVFGSTTEFWYAKDDIAYLYPLYGVGSTCLVLVNFAFAPTMYLVRLLGFRRIMSAL
ncbi:uncharacterized protein LOC120347317 [Styela clava]